ncbi:abortive infection family protein [Micromonospora sp. A3M-1-15]|uniref:abortive infection family protein n=1 Tax=Micromonospora sp. A3M-1-15 TaxID=2962035 RepID=UPI0035AF23BE
MPGADTRPTNPAGNPDSGHDCTKPVQSARCPHVMCRAIGRQRRSAARCSLVVNPPRDRPRLGTGHGGVTAPAGLAPRHARLAVTAATAWINFMLETLTDRAAGCRVAERDAAPPPRASEQPSEQPNRRAGADDHGRSRHGGREDQATDQQAGTDA